MAGWTMTMMAAVREEAVGVMSLATVRTGRKMGVAGRTMAGIRMVELDVRADVKVETVDAGVVACRTGMAAGVIHLLQPPWMELILVVVGPYCMQTWLSWKCQVLLTSDTNPFLGIPCWRSA
jgi:hypothetical protein